MFYRASGVSSGSGLGLYLVKETVKKLEGAVAVQSKLGVGTEFILSFPIKTLENVESITS